MAMDPVEATALYHRLSKNGATLTPSDFLHLVNYRPGGDFQPLDPANRPAPFKHYRSVERIELPRELAPNASDAIRALAGNRGDSPNDFVDVRLDSSLLARLLHLCFGVTRSTIGPLEGRTYFRAAMSAGNLHPLEVYAVCGPMEGLSAGVYHFAPLEFRLDLLRSTDERAFLASACATDDLPSAASLVITGIPWRMAWKYGERGWRHLYWDAGTSVANLVAAADGVGLHTRVLTGFVDQDVARLVGVDGVEEFPLAVVELGLTEAIGTPCDPPAPAPISVAADPLSSNPVVFPLIVEAQRAGVLDSPVAVRTWRAEAKDRAERSKASEAVSPGGVTIDEVILRRGSTRLMRLEQTPQRLLDCGIAVASRDVVGDFRGAGRPRLCHYLNIHAVADTTPGAYVWGEQGLELLKGGDHRARSRRLCLDQPLGGDASYTVFHTTRLDALLDAYGARGYRVANFEAGMASGRLALAAFALGFGATALSFLDDEVPAFFNSAVSCLLVTAVGVPAYQNRRGGAPGEITQLPHYKDLMGRFACRLQEVSGSSKTGRRCREEAR
jgi:SagB-type dehydrogenase family enzyme